MKKKKGSVGGWTLAHIAEVEKDGDKITVTLEHKDARLNGKKFKAVEALAFAEVNWLYAIQFKDTEIVHAMVLDRRQ